MKKVENEKKQVYDAGNKQLANKWVTFIIASSYGTENVLKSSFARNWASLKHFLGFFDYTWEI